MGEKETWREGGQTMTQKNIQIAKKHTLYSRPIDWHKIQIFVAKATLHVDIINA